MVLLVAVMHRCTHVEHNRAAQCSDVRMMYTSQTLSCCSGKCNVTGIRVDLANPMWRVFIKQSLPGSFFKQSVRLHALLCKKSRQGSATVWIDDSINRVSQLLLLSGHSNSAFRQASGEKRLPIVLAVVLVG
eukprot:1142150-Pelagomonas_calceolata.AAC.1